MWAELKKAHFRGVYRVKVPLPTILRRETICSGGSALRSFATANTIVFIHHLRRFLSFSPLRRYRIVWG